jgi:hypothetical protein
MLLSGEQYLSGGSIVTKYRQPPATMVMVMACIWHVDLDLEKRSTCRHVHHSLPPKIFHGASRHCIVEVQSTSHHDSRQIISTLCNVEVSIFCHVEVSTYCNSVDTRYDATHWKSRRDEMSLSPKSMKRAVDRSCP